MNQQTIGSYVILEAQAVRVGDRIHDAAFFGPNKWCVVKAVHETFGNVSLQLAHVTIVKHPKEGIAVQRG